MVITNVYQQFMFFFRLLIHNSLLLKIKAREKERGIAKGKITSYLRSLTIRNGIKLTYYFIEVFYDRKCSTCSFILQF